VAQCRRKAAHWSWLQGTSAEATDLICDCTTERVEARLVVQSRTFIEEMFMLKNCC
jgi:hypothetical protein